MNKYPLPEPSNEALEKHLSAYRIDCPDPSLGARILARALEPVRTPRSERLLRWAWAALLITLVWAQWQERQTGERMAQTAQAVAPAKTLQENEAATSDSRWLHPRIPLPLPEGYPSTCLHIQLGSLPTRFQNSPYEGDTL